MEKMVSSGISNREFVFFAMCAIWATENANAFGPSPYFPLAVGNSWTYTVDGVPGYTRSVIGTQSISGISTYVMTFSEGGQNYLTNDTNGVREHGGYDPNLYVEGYGVFNVNSTFNPPLIYANPASQLGFAASSSGTYMLSILGIGTYPLTYTATSTPQAFEVVSTPLGKFKALRVYTTTSVYGYVGGAFISDFQTETNWVTKKLGVAKQTQSGSGWTSTASITATNTVPAGHVAIADDLVLDFGSYGLWKRIDSGAYTQLHIGDPTMIGFSDLDGNGQADLIADFDVYGMWMYLNNSSMPIYLRSGSPESIVGIDFNHDGKGDVAFDYGSYGLWIFNYIAGSWTQLHTGNPDQIILADIDGNQWDDLIVDFGSYGLWVYLNGATTPTYLHGGNPSRIGSADTDGSGRDDLVIDFGAPYGIWAYMNNSGWSYLRSGTANQIVRADLDNNGVDDVVVDFGDPYGIWAYMDNTSWAYLRSGVPTSLVTADLDTNGQDDLVMDYGAYGIWVYYNNSFWAYLRGGGTDIAISGGMSP